MQFFLKLCLLSYFVVDDYGGLTPIDYCKLLYSVKGQVKRNIFPRIKIKLIANQGEPLGQ